MSNCYSSQAEYEDHDFKDGICKDCGQVDRPAVRELGKRLEEAEAKVAAVRELHRPLVNASSALYPGPHCSCGVSRCPTAAALDSTP